MKEKQPVKCEHKKNPDDCIKCLKQELKDLQATFDLRWNADMRAIKRWQKENPKKRRLTWPDHVDLVCWLLGKLETKEKKCRPKSNRSARSRTAS